MKQGGGALVHLEFPDSSSVLCLVMNISFSSGITCIDQFREYWIGHFRIIPVNLVVPSGNVFIYLTRAMIEFAQDESMGMTNSAGNHYQ